MKSGKGPGQDHTPAYECRFIHFLTGILSKTRWIKEIHIALDNLSAHKTQAAQEFLDANPNVRFHFTPIYFSWLSHVELWFAKIQRAVIDRGIFTSVADLARKIRKYIQFYAKSAKPFRWTYTDSTRHIKVS